MSSYRAYVKDGLGGKIFDVLNVLFMIFFAFIMVYPFWNQFILSINDGTDAARGGLYFWPRMFSLESYKMLFRDASILRDLGISVLRVIVGTGTCLFCTGLLAYIVTIRSFSGRRFMRVLFMITMYFGGGLIPTYLLYSRLGLLNTFAVYWVPGLFSAYYMLLISSYIQNLPEALFEAARIDGCSELRIYIQIVLPMAVPVMAAVAVYVAVGQWNDWFSTTIYNAGGKWDTLQVYLRRMLLEVEALNKVENQALKQKQFKGLSTQTLKAATTMVATIPIIIVYQFLQKYFISGITIGAVKE